MRKKKVNIKKNQLNIEQKISSSNYNYNNAISKTLSVHFYYLLGLIVCFILIKIVYHFISSSQILMSDFQTKHMIKFIFAPILIVSAIIIISKIIITDKKISYLIKAYFLSLSIVAVGITFKAFNSDLLYICIIFDAGIFLTSFYRNMILTTTVFLICLLEKIIIISISLINFTSHNEYTLTVTSISIIILSFIYITSLQIISLEKEKHKMILINQRNLENLKTYARIDDLTKLMNRKALYEHFNKIYNCQANLPSYFIMLDIDNFKEMNDTLGHLHGDSILKNIGKIFQEKDNMTFFRYGGDEFCAFIYINSINKAISEIKSIQNQTRQYSDNSGIPVPIELSVGLTHYNDYHLSPEQIISQADFALYHSKKNKKGSISIFDEIDISEFKDFCSTNR